MKAIRLLTTLAALVLAGCGDGSIQSPNFTPQLQSIAVTPAPTATVADGQTLQFSATGTFSVPPGSNDVAGVRDVTSDVKWTSSNPAIATIDGNGVATGVSEGTTTISASKSGAESNPVLLTVGPGVLEGITIVPANPNVAVGAERELTAQGVYSDDRGTPRPLPAGSTVSWTSSAPTVASIDPTGNPATVGGLNNGTSTITASAVVPSAGTFTGTTVVTVGGPIVPDGGLVRIRPANPTVPVGDTIQLVAVGLFGGNEGDVDNSLIDWTSATPANATINAAGVATGVAEGTSVIKAALKATVTGVTGLREVTTVLTVVDGLFAQCSIPLLDPDAIASPASTGLVSVGNAVANPENVIDADPETFANATTVLGAATGGVGVRVVSKSLTPFVGGQSPGFVIGRKPGDLLDLGLFQEIQISTLLNGAVQETAGSTGALRLSLFGFQLLGENDLSLVTIPAALPYDGLQIILKSRVAGAISNLQIYRACAATQLPTLAASKLVRVLRVEPVGAKLEGSSATDVGAKLEYQAIGEYTDTDATDADGDVLPDVLQIPDNQLNWTVTPGATIDQYGVVTGGTAGVVTVTATLKDGTSPTATPRTASTALEVTASLCDTRFLSPAYKTTSEIIPGVVPLCTAGLCRATNLPNVTDAPKTNHADIDITVGVGLLGDAVAVEVSPATGTTPTPVAAGGKPGFVIGREVGATALLGLLNQFKIETLLNGEPTGDVASSLSPLGLDLLGTTLVGDSEANVLRFDDPTTKAYNGLRLTVSPIVGALFNVRVFSACSTTPP